MNGVEFRTRHNDYKLRMASRSDSTFHKTEYIPFPPVPDSVTKKATVQEQIQEMREYFRAFRDQNTTHRDYRPYFRPVLCYIEGGWSTGTKSLDEPFQSDRHAIDASNWFDLMEKIRYTSYTGSKSVLENYAFLPTTINSVENGHPHYAQWNYRILCHPLKDDLPVSVFKPEDDLLYRFPNRVGMDKVEVSRAQRYHVNAEDVDHYGHGRSLLDNLMMQIPGADNYPADLHDNSFDMVMEDVRFNNHTLVNTGYYHRYFKTLDKGAMGTKSIHRGYSDSNLWVAQTSQPQVAPMTVTTCHKVFRHEDCKSWTSRYTYALPLEIIYMNPLQSWNPFNLETNMTETDIRDHGRRIGGPETSNAYKGTSVKKYHYLTPSDFYSSGTVGPKDPADTAKKGAGVLDRSGNVHMMSSSGIRIVTPNIDGVGMIRMRYPIMPVHGEGSGVWKELSALKDMTMHMNRYASLFEERPSAPNDNGTVDESMVLHFQMSTTVLDPPGEHNHDFFLNLEELDEIKKGSHLTVTTSEDMGHTHELELYYRRGVLKINTCDGLRSCWDAHTNYVTQL
ncbi:uncharacterized protein LOC101855125 [Aplysia californica]|uniref:Uncharacterized protein LOC101855125 n=1 Tax=Aplysia californica TaxID=6500 RepID=A0ABM0JYX0_APLCA|nr:uncharacterized protein LOC101855125 [Aplysia californica]